MATETHKTSRNPTSFVFLDSSLHTSQSRVNVCDIFIICRELANCLKSQFLWHFMAFITETWISHLPAPNVFTKLLEKCCGKFVYEQMWVKVLFFENLERDSIVNKIYDWLFIMISIRYNGMCNLIWICEISCSYERICIVWKAIVDADDNI